MIEQIFEFIGNHYVLLSIFAGLLIAFFITEGKRGGAAISSTHLVNLVNREDALIVDLRDMKAYGNGHIVGAMNLPYTSFDTRANELDAHKQRPLVLVCKMGQHAGAIGRKLKALGFEDVRRLSGGMAEWTASSLPVVK